MPFIPMPNDFQVNKLFFFKDSKYSQSTRVAQWNLYLNFISDIEVSSNKDLYFFEKPEIEKYNSAIKDKSNSTINLTNSFIKCYIKWYSNFYKTINKEFDLISNDRIDNSWYISKLDFYDLCEKLISKVDTQFILPLLLIRYGISGKQMIYLRNIKWKNINFEMNKVIMYTENDEIMLSIPVDFQFLKWMDIIKNIEVKKYKNINIDDSYILQESEYKNIIINYNTVNSRIYYTCKSVGIARIQPYSLDTSAKVDYLYKLSQSGILISGKNIEEKLLKDWYKKDFISIGVAYKLKNLYDDWIKEEGFKLKSTIIYTIKDEENLDLINNENNTVKNHIRTKKAVICLTTKKEFESTTKAGQFYNCDSSRISRCCKGKFKTCGELEDGTRLTWMYLDDYKQMKDKSQQ